jgi:hypothetical protein
VGLKSWLSVAEADANAMFTAARRQGIKKYATN